ncbi:MAG: hybrid sensor histidine kinase/response regulator [Nitrospirae bacterium]|nr:hybrid sensor histidine kinase/response regulator [Nitrospirota bacterium]
MENVGTKIFVVDDDPFVRDMLAMILDAGGYSVETAENGVDAVKKMTGGLVTDVVISDMNMPEMDGNELIRQIRQRNEDIPIIILTGNNEISVAIEAIRGGANDYLLKDENIHETVILAVEKALEKYELKRQNKQLLSDLARKNEELEKSNSELLELNNLKNKFLGMAAHDLRNPLTSISGLSEILIGSSFGPLTEDQKEYLAVINTASNDMLALVNDLLDISVIESGKLDLRTSAVSLAELLEERIKVASVVAGLKSITIEPTLDAAARVDCDRNRIAQVVDNLIGNAVKFSPRGSKIYVALSQNGPDVRVGIRDEGPGIPAAEQSRLFGEFQRLSAQPTGDEKSTGLGLAIVKKIISAHGGRMEVDSKVGEGSTFSFVLRTGA